MLTLALAALLHLLLCAHGPMSPDSARVDTLSAEAAASPGCGSAFVRSERVGAAQMGPTDGDASGCVDADEPTLRAPRDVAAPVTAVDGSPTTPESVPAAAPLGFGGGHPPGVVGGPGVVRGDRALLGVWRT